MTEWYGPFDDTDDLTEARWRQLVAQSSNDGVLDSHGGTGLAVSVAVGSTSVDVAAGAAFLQGSLYTNSATVNKTNTANGGGSARPDRVVLRHDPTGNTNSLLVREGTVGASAPPALTQDATGTWDIPLARWSRSAGGTITSLVDERLFVLRDGRIALADAAITAAVPLTALVPSARKGQVVIALPSFAEYRYSGSFWERVDPAPLLSITSTDEGSVVATTFSSTLTGSTALTGTFTAPASGRVYVQLSAKLNPPTNEALWAAVQITGPTNPSLGAANEGNAQAITYSGTTGASPSLRYPLTGLTAGGTYTATFMTAASGDPANGDVTMRRILIERG